MSTTPELSLNKKVVSENSRKIKLFIYFFFYVICKTYKENVYVYFWFDKYLKEEDIQKN